MSTKLIWKTLVAFAVGSLLAGSVWAQQRPKITGVSHLSVYTSDAAKAEQFYVHNLGAMKAADPEDANGVRYYFNAVQFIEVLPLPADAGPVNRTDHVAYNTTDAEAMREYLAAHHVVVPDAVTIASEGSRYFEVRDPEGNKIQFVQPSAHPLAVSLNPLSSHIIHVGYAVHDSAIEDGFYRELLGFRPYWHGGMKDGVTQWMSLQVPDGTDWVEYMMVEAPVDRGVPAGMSRESLGVLDHFALGVQNMEQAADLLYGGERVGGRDSGPKIGRDGKWQLNMYDPDGIRAELMEFQPSIKPCCSPFLLPSPTK